MSIKTDKWPSVEFIVKTAQNFIPAKGGGFYAAVRRRPEDGYEAVDLATASLNHEDVSDLVDQIGLAVPSWANRAPVVRVARFRLVEFETVSHRSAPESDPPATKEQVQ